jgi:hypothetical protein
MQSVELRIIGDTRGIDLEMPLPRGGEEPAIAGIADQLLVAGTVQRSGESSRFGKGQINAGDPVKSVPKPGTDEPITKRGQGRYLPVF